VKPWKQIAKNSAACIVATSSGVATSSDVEEKIESIKELVKLYGLTPYIYSNLLAPQSHPLFNQSHLPFANTDQVRSDNLLHALNNPVCSVVWCLRGGYGAIRLLKALDDSPEPTEVKLLLGFSDITILHLFLNSKWGWPSLHFGMPGAPDAITAHGMAREDTINNLQQIIYGEVESVSFKLTRLNGNNDKEISGITAGGNTFNIQMLFGTNFQIDLTNKILVLEEVGEEARWLDGFLQKIQMVPNFPKLAAIVFGEFLPLEKKFVFDKIIDDFARHVEIPVFTIFPEDTIGHGHVNRALPLGTQASIDLSDEGYKMVVTTGMVTETSHDDL
jgi:muramoyltetrapeptide carboxypeptidase